MIYLVVVLIISHFVVLYYINKFIKAYKINNQNFINKELKKLQGEFSKGLETIDANVAFLTEKTSQSFEQLKTENINFIASQKTNLNSLTSFIKTDYHSLTQLVQKSNGTLEALLKKTEENISKNRELKPLLVDSNIELEKVYGKIKLLITNYEKNINDIKGQMENSLHLIESTIEGKIKQLAVNGEKIMLDSVENSKNTINKVTDETNNGLKKVLKENQIKELITKVESLDSELKNKTSEVLNSIQKLDVVVLEALKKYNDKEGNKKGFFGF